jgi:hypothetical protein
LHAYKKKELFYPTNLGRAIKACLKSMPKWKEVVFIIHPGMEDDTLPEFLSESSYIFSN